VGSRPGDCTACGVAVKLHFDERNRRLSCADAASVVATLDRGRLFKLKVDRNREARQAALATIREIPGGRWQARVGGRLRGRTVTGTRAQVEALVNEHYNNALHAFVTRKSTA